MASAGRFRYSSFRKGRVLRYECNANGKLETVDATEMIRIYNPDSSNPWQAKSILKDHILDIETDFFIRQHVRRRFQMDSAPRTVLETADANESLPSPEELQAFNLSWRNAMSSRTGSNTGGVSIIKPAWTAKALDGSTDYTALVEMLKQSERTLLHAFGVPETLVGASESINRATTEASQHIFDTYCVTPLQSRLRKL